MGIRAFARVVAWVLLLSGLSGVAYAAEPIRIEVVQPVMQGGYSVGVGSKLSITPSGESEPKPAIFLGSTYEPDGSLFSYIVYEPQEKTVEYLPASSVEMTNTGLQKILKLYDQEGGTCAAYALDDYLQQLHLNGFVGSGTLAQTLSTEQGRTQLLVDIVNEYYLDPSHQNSTVGILNGFGKSYGFKCKKSTFSDVESVRAFFSRELGQGSSVIVSFNIGPDMFDSPYRLIDANQADQPLDNRLWLPRKKGERNSGGHVVVAVASFVFDGKLRFVMLDSDWDEPRVWDFETVFNAKTALNEIEFDSCH